MAPKIEIKIDGPSAYRANIHDMHDKYGRTSNFHTQVLLG